jgi:hypothetical protein
MNRFEAIAVATIVGLAEVTAIVLVLACIAVWAGIAAGSL